LKKNLKKKKKHFEEKFNPRWELELGRFVEYTVYMKGEPDLILTLCFVGSKREPKVLLEKARISQTWTLTRVLSTGAQS
jgi:hypothetical protein